jgi:hypothetical protein
VVELTRRVQALRDQLGRLALPDTPVERNLTIPCFPHRLNRAFPSERRA